MATPNQPLLVFPKEHLSLCTLQPYTVGADGSWTAVVAGAFTSGPVSLLGYLDSVVLSIEQMNLEAISVDAGYNNRIPTILDASAVVTENYRYQVGAGAGGVAPAGMGLPADSGVVAGLCVQYGHVQLQWAYNKYTTHNDIYTLYGVWRRYSPGVQGLGIQKPGFMIELADTSITTVSGVAGIKPITVVRS